MRFQRGRTYRIDHGDRRLWVRVESCDDDLLKGWAGAGRGHEPVVIPVVEIETAIEWIEGIEGIRQRAGLTDPRD